MNKKVYAVLAVLAYTVVASGHAVAVPTFFGPTPYLSSSDSPFTGGSFAYFHLENFEDVVLNTPGVTASGSWSPTIPSGVSPGFFDSVDADDGVIDGSGTGGRSFFSQFQNTALTLRFNAVELGGNLPTHAGIVWTDVGRNLIGQGVGNRPVTFSATDSIGVSLGSVGPFVLGDGVLNGTTAEDRFFGIFNEGGISSITISMSNFNNWEVDHLQYGFLSGPGSGPTPGPGPAPIIPEPSTVLLLGSGVIGLLGIRKLRKSKGIS